MFKLAFFDIDGTLLSHRTHRVPPRTRRALAALRDREVRTVVATGRHPMELDAARLDGMVFDGFAAANGQMCLDGDRRLFMGRPIPREGVAALARIYEQGEPLLWLFGESTSCANRAGDDSFAMAEQAGGVPPEVGPYGGDALYQAVAFVSVDQEPALAAQLPGCSLHRWGSEGVDIIAADGGKVEGMRAFLLRFDCAREECIAFGDQHNDVEMLRFAGMGVAMGNGTAAAKEAADHVTSSVDDDGVARALERVGLLEPGWDG